MEQNYEAKWVFPLTILQIGDLQSYLSDLNLFLAHESKKIYVLVDNRPWLNNLGPRPAHLWQLMVTKSRLSPFANTKGQRDKKPKEGSSGSNCIESKKLRKWVSLIDAAKLSEKRESMKKLQSSFFLKHGLHMTLYGFIVFEVSWSDVRGISYLNELQRWEFESIDQAARCVCSWFLGTKSERSCLKDYLNTAIGEVFYDANGDFSRTTPIKDDGRNFSNYILESNSDVHNSTTEKCGASEPHTPPPDTVHCKKRRVTKLAGMRLELDFCSKDNESSEHCVCEKIAEATEYRDVFLFLRFKDHDLPFKLQQVVLSDLRLLTLLEAGLPSWVMFLQSYPGFCHLYRPWMCPLVRTLFVLISMATVVIGFYDLFKNVLVLKATISRICGPLFDWVETWDMISRIKYLGTMLFLHNFQKAMHWLMATACAARLFFSFLGVPFVRFFMEVIGFVLPIWNLVAELAESFFSIIWIAVGSSCGLVRDVIEITLFPIWFIISLVWKFAACVFRPAFWILCEIMYAPIRIFLASANFLAVVCSLIFDVLGDVWRSISSLIQLASASQATVTAYEVSLWQSLWNDLFSQVFRALRSILNGFILFFAACNRHRLSICNHIQDLIQRLLGRTPRSESSDSRHRGSQPGY